jgi:hypothetical protein
MDKCEKYLNEYYFYFNVDNEKSQHGFYMKSFFHIFDSTSHLVVDIETTTKFYKKNI